MLHRIGIGLAVLTALVSVAHADEGGHDRAHWVASWAAAMQTPLFAEPQIIENQTLRQIVRLSRGGQGVRVRLSNSTGTTPLRIDAASVAVRAEGAAVVPDSVRALRFGGATSITIPPRAIAVSDPLTLRTEDEADLAISLFVTGPAPATTQLTQSHQTSFISEPGDFTASTSFTPASTITSWYWLSGVDVLRPRTRAIVAFGDSITEGWGSTTDANNRWPDVLARRLIANRDNLTVVDAAISGNRVLNDEMGPNALSRLDRDIFTQSGAEFAIVLEGINDIGIPIAGASFLPPGVALTEVSAEEIIVGHKQIIRRAHAEGIAIFGATLTAIGTSAYETPESEAKRQAVNAWIRTGGDYDGVIDFDAATRDPEQPSQLLAAYDSGDHLHPNDAGYTAMAQAIDLGLFHAHFGRAVCE